MLAYLYSILKRVFRHTPTKAPAQAYDIWAASYDEEQGNLMVILDTGICSTLLSAIPLQGLHIADVGCGTGRHWAMLYAAHPAQLRGFDVSAAMLSRLQHKYPDACTSLVADHRLAGLADHSCNLLLSTLALAHFDDIALSLSEWDRVVKPGGDIVWTDYHPDALMAGGTVSFRSGKQSMAIRHHIYTLERIRELAAAMGWQEIQFIERKIDDTMRHYYAAQQALATFDRFNGVPIIYGIHFRKTR